MKPSLFIGSSTEGLGIAYAAQQNLRFTAEVTVWDQGVFQLSKTSLESLLAVLDRTDFGMFVFSPDDIVIIRGEHNQAVRDNVLFELGLFTGRLGRDRCFILMPEDARDVRLPTDLIGVTPATFEVGRRDGSMQAATGPACHSVREAIQRVCPRGDQQQSPNVGPELREQTESETVAQKEPKEPSVAEAKAAEPEKYKWFDAFVIKDYSEAIALLDEQIALLSEGDERLDLETWRGRAQFRLDPSLGTATMETLISGHPESTDLYISLAYAHLGRGLFDDALNVLDRGLELAAAKEGLFVAKARILHDIGRDEEAIALVRSAVVEEGQRASYYHQLATILRSMGKRDEARHTVEEGLALCLDDKELLIFYAEELYQGPDKKLALIPYNRLLSLDPQSTRYLTLRGNLYLELELFDLAMRDYKSANELAREKEAWILANIGNLYKNRGFFSDGIEHLKKALVLAPEDDYAHQRLAVSLELRQKEEERLQTLVKEAYKSLVAQRMGTK